MFGAACIGRSHDGDCLGLFSVLVMALYIKTPAVQSIWRSKNSTNTACMRASTTSPGSNLWIDPGDRSNDILVLDSFQSA